MADLTNLGDRLYFDPKTPPATIVAYLKRLAAGEKAEDIRAEISAAEVKAAATTKDSPSQVHPAAASKNRTPGRRRSG